MKKQLFFQLLLICLLLYFLPSSASSMELVKVTNNQDEFLNELSDSIKIHQPLVLNQGLSQQQIEQFQSLYKPKYASQSELLSSSYRGNRQDGAVIVATQNSKWKAMATHIAQIKDYDLVMEEDLQTEKNKKYDYSEILLIGEDATTPILTGTQHVFNSNEAIQKLYDSIVSDPELYVYVESEQYINEALYMAAFRKGKLVFNLDELTPIETTDKYLTWFVEPLKFSGDKYITMYRQFPELKAISVMTASTPGEVNLMLNKSFYYDQLNLNSFIFSYADSMWDDTEIKKEGDWTLAYQGDKQGIDEALIQQASYISMFAHGSSSGFKVANKSFDRFPTLQAPVVVAEACSTLDYMDNRNIALNAISQGAVAYVGSFKVGGVNGNPFSGSDSYLLSHSEVPLSEIVKINNQYIMSTFDKVPRAVLIGDPYFYYIRNKTAISLDQNQLHVELPFDFGISKNIYFHNKEEVFYNSVSESQGDLSVSEIVKNLKHTSIVSLTGTNGVLTLSLQHNWLAELQEIMKLAYGYLYLGVSQVVDNGVFLVTWLLCMTPFWMKWYKHGFSKDNIIYAGIFTVFFLCIELFLFQLSPYSWNRSIFYFLSLLLLNNTKFKMKFQYFYIVIATLISGLLLIVVLVKSLSWSTLYIGVMCLIYYGMLYLLQKWLRFQISKLIHALRFDTEH